MVKRTNRKAGKEAERRPQKVRLVLDILDRIRSLTPQELRDMPYETLREVMLFMGLDPDEPLPDEILRLIEKVQSEKPSRPELRLVPAGDAIQPGENTCALKSDEQEMGAPGETAGPGETARDDEPSTLSRPLASPVVVRVHELSTVEDRVAWRQTPPLAADKRAEVGT
jgi:hypothetical protein